MMKMIEVGYNYSNKRPIVNSFKQPPFGTKITDLQIDSTTTGILRDSEFSYKYNNYLEFGKLYFSELNNNANTRSKIHLSDI